MNNENGLPPEVQKFLDKYCHSDAERAEFIDTYWRQKNDQERQKFLARYAAEPTDDEHAENLRSIEKLKQSKLN